MLSLCVDHDCAATFIDMVAALVANDVTNNTCDLLSSATLVVLLKKYSYRRKWRPYTGSEVQLTESPRAPLAWAAPSPR
jgi:hypothetical protein